MFKKFIIILFTIALSTSCNFFQPKTSVIRIKGSDTMLGLIEILAREYMKLNPNVAIYVDGGGSKNGIASLTSKEIDIAMVSRLLTPNEVAMFAMENHSIGISYLIAKDAISIYINPENPVKDFTTDELRRIFTCKINNWKELGGFDHMINLYIRNPNSGTYYYFQQIVLNGESFCSAASSESNTNKLVGKIAKDKYAIGFGGIGFNDGVEHAKVNGIEPTEENVRKDLYPLSRYLYFITLKQPEGAVKSFIDWALSHYAQSLIKQSGYVPIWSITY
ncbi:MAG: PstS family phosphate ABC transporter substrate-binding protein [Bacteroidota bacterium]